VGAISATSIARILRRRFLIGLQPHRLAADSRKRERAQHASRRWIITITGWTTVENGLARELAPRGRLLNHNTLIQRGKEQDRAA
jgi:hypothetical protein